MIQPSAKAEMFAERVRVASKKHGRRSKPHLRAVVERAPQPERQRLPLGVVEQVRLALRKGSRLAFVLGVLGGGFVPLATFFIWHAELNYSDSLWVQPAAAFGAGGLLFSAVTIYQWARLAFAHWAKAFGFVLLLEGTMVTAHTHWLAVAALGYLIAINAVATACTLTRSGQSA